MLLFLQIMIQLSWFSHFQIESDEKLKKGSGPLTTRESSSKTRLFSFSDAMLRTRLLAETYARQAEDLIDIIAESDETRNNLRKLTHMVTHRDK